MSLLDRPEARGVLADAVRDCRDRLAAFLGRYLPRFRRAEQRANAALVLRGLLGGLQRKTCELIAVEAGLPRKPIQFFVGAGRWDDEAVMAELRRHVAEDFGDDRAVLVGDATTSRSRGRLLQRRAVVPPARQAGELPARDLPGLRRGPRVRPAGPATVPATGLGRLTCPR